MKMMMTTVCFQSNLQSFYMVDFRSRRIAAKTASKFGLKDSTGKSVTTCWQFGDLNTLKRIWVERIFAGDEITAWGELEMSGDLEIDMDTSAQLELPPNRQREIEKRDFSDWDMGNDADAEKKEE